MKKLLLLIPLLAFILMLPWVYISWITDDTIYRDIEKLPEREVGLLLGTTPSVGEKLNMFYVTRIEATKLLYEKRKIHHIIVSGDNSTVAYNEPKAMQQSLIKAGIPESDITLDYAGFRTLDSVVRAKEIFGQGSGFTIISQPFHVERALFLAQVNHIDAIGFGAANVSLSIGPRVYVREIFARWVAIYDAIMGTDPVVLGQKEKLNGE